MSKPKKMKVRRCGAVDANGKVCRSPAAPRRRMCWACIKAEHRARNPVWAIWRAIHDKARQRGIRFALPFDWFRAQALAAGYVERRGTAPEALHIDRIDARRGYVPDNIQFLTAAENCAKGAAERGRVLLEEDTWEGPGE